MNSIQLVSPGGVQEHRPWPHELLSGVWSEQLERLTKGRGYRLIAERRFADLVGADALLIDGGEQVKTVAQLEALVAQLIESGLTRDHVVVGLGGGAATDLIGLAAATVLRGVDWVAVPTTVLAAVDASIGGKTAVNLALGKNLLGAFHQPLGVIVDRQFWDSLPPLEWRSGAVEIFKSGLLRPELMSALMACETAQAAAGHAVAAAQLKLDVVSADPQEKGLRAALNLGHTLGHALESQGAGRLRHGEAVAIGLSAVLRISHPQADELIERLNRWGLPTRVPEWADVEGLVHLMRRDKKSNAQGLRVVLPQASSSCVLVEGFEPERLLA